MYVREDIPTQWRVSAFVCQRRYTDSMKGVCFCYVREDIPTQWRGLLLYVRKDIPTQWSLLLYVREDIPTQ